MGWDEQLAAWDGSWGGGRAVYTLYQLASVRGLGVLAE